MVTPRAHDLTPSILVLKTGEESPPKNGPTVERGVAGSDPSTWGRIPVVLEVRFRSRAFSIAEIQSEIVLG